MKIDKIHLYIRPYTTKTLYHAEIPVSKKISRFLKEHGFDVNFCSTFTSFVPIEEIKEIDDNFNFKELDESRF